MGVKIKYDKQTMKVMAFFESMTNIPLKDCIANNSQFVFVVHKGNIGKAIGKNGVNAKKLQNALKRKIKIVEFNPLPTEFVKSLISPLMADVSEEDSIIRLRCTDGSTRSLLIGRDARNIRNYENIVKRYFDKKLKVI